MHDICIHIFIFLAAYSDIVTLRCKRTMMLDIYMLLTNTHCVRGWWRSDRRLCGVEHVAAFFGCKFMVCQFAADDDHCALAAFWLHWMYIVEAIALLCVSINFGIFGFLRHRGSAGLCLASVTLSSCFSLVVRSRSEINNDLLFGAISPYSITSMMNKTAYWWCCAAAHHVVVLFSYSAEVAGW